MKPLNVIALCVLLVLALVAAPRGVPAQGEKALALTFDGDVAGTLPESIRPSTAGVRGVVPRAGAGAKEITVPGVAVTLGETRTLKIVFKGDQLALE
jgi:hypothetical protein